MNRRTTSSNIHAQLDDVLKRLGEIQAVLDTLSIWAALERLQRLEERLEQIELKVWGS